LHKPLRRWHLKLISCRHVGWPGTTSGAPGTPDHGEQVPCPGAAGDGEPRVVLAASAPRGSAGSRARPRATNPAGSSGKCFRPSARSSLEPAKSPSRRLASARRREAPRLERRTIQPVGVVEDAVPLHRSLTVRYAFFNKTRVNPGSGKKGEGLLALARQPAQGRVCLDSCNYWLRANKVEPTAARSSKAPIPTVVEDVSRGCRRAHFRSRSRSDGSGA
jgi:hypothetical protein